MHAEEDDLFLLVSSHEVKNCLTEHVATTLNIRKQHDIHEEEYGIVRENMLILIMIMVESAPSGHAYAYLLCVMHMRICICVSFFKRSCICVSVSAQNMYMQQPPPYRNNQAGSKVCNRCIWREAKFVTDASGGKQSL
jgi:hypothetical protein